MSDDKFCEAILNAMRSVFVGVNYDTPVTEDWAGTADEAGVKDYIISLLHDHERKAYLHAYAGGVIDTVHDMGGMPKDKVFNIGNNRIMAENKFLEWKKR